MSNNVEPKTGGVMERTSAQHARGWKLYKRRRRQALSQGKTSLRYEPLRQRNKMRIVAVFIAIATTIAVFAFALLRPAGQIRNSNIVEDRDSRGIYVKVNNIWYQAENLTSAQLIIGSNTKPTEVGIDQLATVQRGGLVGIIGAPPEVEPNTPKNLKWAVCDTVGNQQSSGDIPVTTTVIVSPLKLNDKDILNDTKTVPGSFDGKTYIIWNDQKFLVKLTDRAIVDALGIDLSTERPLSVALFNAIPTGGTIVRPEINQQGSQQNYLPLSNATIGTVGYVESTDKYYVFEKSGLQEIPLTLSTLIRDIYSKTSNILALTPQQVISSPIGNEIDTSGYPTHTLKSQPASDNPDTCYIWGYKPGKPETYLYQTSTLPIPDGQSPVPVVGHNPGGWATADQTWVPAGSGILAATTDDNSTNPTLEQPFYISANGIRYQIDNSDPNIYKTLGLMTKEEKPKPLTPTYAPWAIASLLPQGPELSRANALVEHAASPPLGQAQPLEGK